jgi:hypothetical protein
MGALSLLQLQGAIGGDPGAGAHDSRYRCHRHCSWWTHHVGFFGGDDDGCAQPDCNCGVAMGGSPLA